MKINGKEYRIPEIDYNAVCALDRYDIDLLGLEGQPQPFVMLRAFLALAMGPSRNNATTAGKELEKHILENGIEDTEIARAFKEITQALEDSDFLSQMKARQVKQTPSSESVKATQKTPSKSSAARPGVKKAKASEPTISE